MPTYKLVFAYGAAPPKFVSNPAELLQLAKTRQWDMIYPPSISAARPEGQGMGPNKRPDPGDPAGGGLVNVALWNTSNTMFGNQTIDQLFATPTNPYEWIAPTIDVDPNPATPEASMQTITPGPITVVMPGGAATIVTTLEELGGAIDAGAQVIRDDGTAAVIQDYLGGKLVDGNPLNVILGSGWIDGQWEAIQQGLATGEVTMPPTAAPPSSIPWWLIAAAAGVGVLLLRRGK